jgi:hypothetical protein
MLLNIFIARLNYNCIVNRSNYPNSLARCKDNRQAQQNGARRRAQAN